MPSAEFQQAAADVKNLKTKPNNDQLLQLYSLFKVANGDTPEKPGMFDLTGKAKYAAWEKVKDKPQDEAEKEYIALVESLKAELGTN